MVLKKGRDLEIMMGGPLKILCDNGSSAVESMEKEPSFYFYFYCYYYPSLYLSIWNLSLLPTWGIGKLELEEAVKKTRTFSVTHVNCSSGTDEVKGFRKTLMCG